MKHPMARSLVVLLAIAAAAVPSAARAGQPDAEPAATWEDEAAWDIPGEWVVDFRDDVALSAIDALVTALGGAPTLVDEGARIAVVRAPAVVAGTMLGALRADTSVEYVEPHARVRALFVPNDPMYAEQWHLARVGAERAWRAAIGRGVTVAVVDTGVACETFDDFTRATDLAETRCVAGWDFVNRRARAADDQGHGTHVAGTIAQSTNNDLGAAGLAFGARLMPVKVLAADGFGTTTAVAAGIRFAADHGAHVINLSLGGPRASVVLQRAVDHARGKGSVVVAAAGNSGGRVGWPAAARGVVGVSATDERDALAWFSSRGRGVDLAAPGVRVLQQTVCDHGRNRCEIFSSYNGTSMASPHVAAAAALLVGLGVTNADVVARTLAATARMPKDARPDHLGAGIVQADAAVFSVLRAQLAGRAVALVIAVLVAWRWAARRARRTGGAAARPTLGFALGGLATSVGLLCFAPWLLDRQPAVVAWLSRPIGDWSSLIGASLHRLLPLANVAVPLGLAVVLLRWRAATRFVAGVSVGTAAYLGAALALGHAATPFGWLATTAWCAVNALGCLYLGSLLMTERSRA
jgi:serine protease